MTAAGALGPGILANQVATLAVTKRSTHEAAKKTTQLRRAELRGKTVPALAEPRAALAACKTTAALDAYGTHFCLGEAERPSFLNRTAWATVRRAITAKRTKLETQLVAHEDSLYANEVYVRALAAATYREQRGRWEAIQQLDDVLASGVHPTTKRKLGLARYAGLVRERAEILRTYEGTYDEYAGAFGVTTAEELRRQVEGKGACAPEHRAHTQATQTVTCTPLDFASESEFGCVFRHVASDLDERQEAVRGDWLGTFAGRQTILRITIRPLGAGAADYLDARIVAGGADFSGAQLTTLAQMIAAADTCARPCRVRLAHERYRAGRVRGAAQGLVGTAAPAGALDLDGLAMRAGRTAVAEQLLRAHGAAANDVLAGLLDLLVAERYYAGAGARGAALDEELARLDARINSCLLLRARLGKKLAVNASNTDPPRYVRGRRPRPARRAAADERQLLLFAAAV